MIKVGIVGGTGYTGVELLRLLTGHPHAEVTVVTSRSEAGRDVADRFPNLRGYVDLAFTDPARAALRDCDMVFFATPHGIAMAMAGALLEAGVRVVDLSADFRLADAVEWQRWYHQVHTAPGPLAEAVYGLPELNRKQLSAARLVANPGCYPTAVVLGLLPLVEAGVVELDSLVADAKSGVSGAGRQAQIGLLLAEASDNFRAYSVSGHRHLPEIRQCLGAAAGVPVPVTFVPHLVPMIRGIHATLYARLRDPGVNVQELFEQRYRDEQFVDVLPAGSHPETRSVRGANTCRLAVHRPGDGATVVVLSVIDNLVKGAAGQAVQNMNLLFGLDEAAGLGAPALLP
ncbi:MAG: N-acetyl-gamma-glutamyl-phosphate reductase [Chromatiales bacterium 21-64-14]|nr:MAG: N-acetyl-gamma-glutamyl-phosphate reductase [Chromatiales bacterium 21-64-14]HQU16601.1 N-acetyl-gamma-glutamyl-phosphate reductase [Gammaproteobacteria bacterium]